MSDKQGCEWLRLYRRIKTVLKQYGKADYVTDDGLQVADYYLVQDNWGGPLHQVEIHSLHLLQPVVIKSLQGVLCDFPEWEIAVGVDVPGREETWPGMGLTIYADSISDGLRREYLPAEYQSIVYDGAVAVYLETGPAAKRKALGREPPAGSEQHETEWKEIYERTKRALESFGTDNEAGGDYFVIDLVPNDKVQMVELHRLHMLRPEVIKSLHALLTDFPDWQIEVYVLSPEENVIIDPESGLVLRHDGIIDALDRELLPKHYRFVYEGSRPAPKDFKL